MKQTTVWEYIRVKFIPGTDKRTKYSRPTRIYKVTYYDEGGKVTDIQFAPAGVKGTARRIDASDFITEWEHGPVPTPKPSRMYSDEQLKGWGYSEEVIKKIRRNFSSKDIKLVSNRLKISRKEANELLTKFKGSKYAVYCDAFPDKVEKKINPEQKQTIGVRIDGEWKILPTKKTEFHRRRQQSLKGKLKLSKKTTSKKRHKIRTGRFSHK